MNSSMLSYGLAVASMGVCLMLVVARLARFDHRPDHRSDAPRDRTVALKHAVPGNLTGLFRFVWPLIEFVAGPCHGLSALLMFERQQQQLTRAGFEEPFGPAQWLACRLLLSLTAASLVAMFLVVIGSDRWWLMAISTALIFALANAWLERRARQRRHELLSQLPFFIDLTVICLESGLNLSAAIEQAVRQGPRGALLRELQKVTIRLRSGQSIRQTLEGLAQACHLIQIDSVVSSLVAAQASGSDLGQVLRALAQQNRDERYFEAEQQAMRAPVKMLLPLLLFVFPCTFLILLFPIAMRLMSEGILK